MADNRYLVTRASATELAEYERYSPEDVNLIESFNVNSAFDSQKHASELHIYTTGNTLLRSISNYTNYKIELGSGGNEEGSSTVYVDPQADAISYGYRNGGVKLLYLFFDNLFSETKLGPLLYIKEISNDRTELKLSSTGILNEDLKKFALAIKDRIEDTSFFSEFRLNFGNNELFIGINIDYSDEEDVVTVKLYEPLPIRVNTKATLNICEFVSDPVAYEVEAEFTPDAPTVPRLREANFNIDLEDNTSTPSQYFNYDELFSYSVDNSNYQVYSLFNEKGAELSIDHKNYEDFIHFSSAEERLINFKYKLDLLNNYSSSIQNINSELGSSGVTSDKQHFENLIEGIVNNFDHYERFLYFESGSNSWPKYNSKKPYVNQESSTSEAITWFADQRTAANNYDVSNFNALTNTIPTFIREDDNNAQYTLFVQMIAQHFDNLWIYSKAVSDKYNADNRLNVGVSRDLVEEAIKSLGVKLYNSSNSLEDLFKYFVGEFTQDTGEGINENVQAGNIVTRTKEVIGTEEIQVPVEVTEGEFTGFVMKLSPSFSRVGMGGSSHLVFYIKDTDKRHELENPNIDIENITAKEVAELFNPPYIYSSPKLNYKYPQLIIDGTPKIAFKPGLDTEIKQIVKNPENIQEFSISYNALYYFTFTFSNDRTDPVTGEVVPAGSYGPYKYRFLGTHDQGLQGFDTNSSTSHGLRYGHFVTKTRSFADFLSNPEFTIAGSDQDRKKIIKLFRAGMTRDAKDSSNSFAKTGLFTVDNLDVEITISDESSVETTTTIYETQTIQTTKTVTEKVVEPFDTLPKDLYQKSVYKRIYHNLPFLLKTKGTQRGLRALINCFGIPYNIMKIRTSGGRLNSERPFFGTELQSSLEANNIRTDNYDTIISGSTLSQFTTIAKPEDTYNQDLHNIEVGFSPSDNLNALIVNTLGSTFNVDDYIGDPRDLTADSYNGLLAQVKTALADITEKYDVKDFVRLIKFFDNVVFKMIKDFVPARSTVDTGVIIKPHILDKSKAKSVSVSATQPEYSGSISVGEYSGSHGGIYQGVATGSFYSNGRSAPLPYPLKEPGEYSTSYIKLLQTPKGLAFKNFFKLSTNNAEQARFDGELQGSEVRVTSGELNEQNPFKKINYPTIKYNIRFLETPIEDVCYLQDIEEEYFWFVDEDNFENTDTTTGNHLDIISLFPAIGVPDRGFIVDNENTTSQFSEVNGSFTTLVNNPLEGSKTSVNLPILRGGTTIDQYGTIRVKAENSILVEGDGTCNGERDISFIRCGLKELSPSEDEEIPIDPSKRGVDLRDYFTGLDLNYKYQFSYLINGTGETIISNPESFTFSSALFASDDIITIKVFDTEVQNKGRRCEATKTFKFDSCALDPKVPLSQIIKNEPHTFFNFDNPEEKDGVISNYYIQLLVTDGDGNITPADLSPRAGQEVVYNLGYDKSDLFADNFIKIPSGIYFGNIVNEENFTPNNIINAIFDNPPAVFKLGGLDSGTPSNLTHIKYRAENPSVDGDCIKTGLQVEVLGEPKEEIKPFITLHSGIKQINNPNHQDLGGNKQDYIGNPRYINVSPSTICDYPGTTLPNSAKYYYAKLVTQDDGSVVKTRPTDYLTPLQLKNGEYTLFTDEDLRNRYSPGSNGALLVSYSFIVRKDEPDKEGIVLEDGDKSSNNVTPVSVNSNGLVIAASPCKGTNGYGGLIGK